MSSDRDFAFEAWLFKRQLVHDHVHLMSDRLEDPWPEAWIQVREAVGYCVIIHVLGRLEVAWNCDLLQPVAKPEGLLHLSFPIDHVRDYLVRAIKVASTHDLLDARMQLLLSYLLTVEIRTDSVDHQDKINLFFLLIFYLLDAELRFQFNFLAPGCLPHAWTPGRLCTTLFSWRRPYEVVIGDLSHVSWRLFLLLYELHQV